MKEAGIRGTVNNYKPSLYPIGKQSFHSFFLQTPTKNYNCKISGSDILYDGLKITVNLKSGENKGQYYVNGYKINEIVRLTEDVCISQIAKIVFKSRKSNMASKTIYNLLTQDGTHDIHLIFHRLAEDKTLYQSILKSWLTTKWPTTVKLGEGEFKSLIDDWRKRGEMLLWRCLGVKEGIINRIQKHGYNEFYNKLKTNPFLLYNLDVEICEYMCRKYNVSYTKIDVKIAEVTREMHKAEKEAPYQTRFPVAEMKVKLTEEERQDISLDKHGIGCVDDCLYFKSTYDKEKKLAQTLIHLIEQAEPNTDYQRVEINESFGLKGKQPDAIKAVLANNLTVVCGGAGTGKSNVIGVLAKILSDQEIPFQCCAFTGKAVAALKKKLTVYIEDAAIREKCIVTMHKIINLTGHARTNYYDDLEDGGDENPETDYVTQTFTETPAYIIIDEASMVTGDLLLQFLQCYPMGTKLVLVGDNAQLAPFGGWGQPFNTLLKYKIGAQVELDTNLRLDSEGQILNTAFAAVKRGNIDNIATICKTNLCIHTGNVEKCYEIYQDLRVNKA